MSFRAFVELLARRGDLTKIRRKVDPNLELAGVVYALRGKPALFEDVSRPGWQVAAGICGSRDLFALALGVDRAELVRLMAKALDDPTEPSIEDHPACREVVEPDVDLNRLPILTHTELDGGPYVTTGIVVTRDPQTGLNASFHRLMQIGPREFVGRVVEGRGLDTAWRRSTGDLPIAVCIGNSLPVLLAASMSPNKGVNELSIANSLQKTAVTRCIGSDLMVPADTEIVLEGRLTHRMTGEGSFIDLTGTLDFVREQPVFEIDAITHRHDPIYHALLPGGSEHKMLMGMPREPTIFAEVSRDCDCRNVYITPGGTSWLHAVVQIEKHAPDDGTRAIEAAFRGHTSLKHVVVVDTDVDPFDMADVEWAIATRFQAARSLIVLLDQPSSSLDPSASHVPGSKTRTSKMGLDATIPWTTPDGCPLSEAQKASFRRVSYRRVELEKYL